MYDGTLEELKEVRYIPCITKNLISVGALEAEGLRGTLGEGVLMISSDSLVVLKSIRHNNLYYLIGSAVTGLASSGQLDTDSIKSWHSGFRWVQTSWLEDKSSIRRCIDLPFEST